MLRQYHMAALGYINTLVLQKRPQPNKHCLEESWVLLTLLKLLDLSSKSLYCLLDVNSLTTALA